jgi:cytochrome oxidase Cu insertion factor (SCO1/SenC/PrrC family)
MKNIEQYVQRAAVSVAVLLVVWTLWGQYQKKHAPAPVSQVESSAAIESEFQLIDQDGKPLSNRDLFGKYQLIYFGFTHCPDICPVDLAKITNVMKVLGNRYGKEIVPLFITLDPVRDTPQVMKDYLSSFSATIRGLTGDEQAIKTVAKAFYVAHEKKPGEADDYAIIHSGRIYLMDRNGRNQAIFSGEDTVEKMVETIQMIISQGK